MNYLRKQIKLTPSYGRSDHKINKICEEFSFFHKELNSIYNESTTASSISEKDLTSVSSNFSNSNLLSTIATGISELHSGLISIALNLNDLIKPTLDFIVTEGELESLSDETGDWVEDSDVVFGDDRVLADSSVSIFISILIISLCFLTLTVLIIIFIKHRAFFQNPHKSKNFEMS